MRTLIISAALALASALACATLAAPSKLLAVGRPAPAFSALDQSGKARTLAEFAGKPLLVFFYPRDGTPGCTREACALRDAWTEYERAGVAVVGVSTDDVAAHERFAREHRLPFALLADTDERMARAFGVEVYFRMARRVSFLLDAQGRVARVFPDVDPAVHAAEVLKAAAELAARP